MTDEKVNETPEASQQEEIQTIRPEDIKSLGEMLGLLMQTEGGLVEWAKKKITDTGYVQAVQTELAMHKGDAHGFALRVLIGFMQKQDARIEALENLLAKALGAAKKGK